MSVFAWAWSGSGVGGGAGTGRGGRLQRMMSVLDVCDGDQGGCCVGTGSAKRLHRRGRILAMAQGKWTIV